MRKMLLGLMAGAALAALAGGAHAQSVADAKQGGEMIVTYKDDVSTLDPAIGYDWQNWSMIKSLFDGLMDYEPGTSTLRNDLAERFGHALVMDRGRLAEQGRFGDLKGAGGALQRLLNAG